MNRFPSRSPRRLVVAIAGAVVLSRAGPGPECRVDTIAEPDDRGLARRLSGERRRTAPA